MSKKIELSKLTLTTKEGTEVDLTVADAKDLYEQFPYNGPRLGD